MRTKSSNTKACGDCANCTQSFGSLCCVGSKILPSFLHFIALIALVQLSVQHRQTETVPAHLVAEVGQVGLSIDVRTRADS